MHIYNTCIAITHDDIYHNVRGEGPNTARYGKGHTPANPKQSACGPINLLYPK
jgi:hypothetical protein